MNVERQDPDRLVTGSVLGQGLKVLGKNGHLSLRAKKQVVRFQNSKIVRDVNSVWDERKFKEPREALTIGKIPNLSEFEAEDCPLVRDLPIKFPNVKDYRLPTELRRFSSIIQTSIDFEHSINPAIEKYFTYLTIAQDFVQKGGRHRSPNLHSDGVQGPRYQVKTLIGRTYLATNTEEGVVIYKQPFYLSKGMSDTHYLTSVFNRQSDDSSAQKTLGKHLIVIDDYTVHRSPTMCEGVKRTLFRLCFSCREADREGNTINLSFDYDWKMEKRPVPNFLKELPTEFSTDASEIERS